MPVEDSKKKDSSLVLARGVADCLQKRGAAEVVLLDFSGRKEQVADYFVIASGGSALQIGSLCEFVLEHIKGFLGRTPPFSEGLSQCRWSILDYVDVVVHLFQQELRLYYDLESLWGDAVRIEI
ncbi:MAG: ribosome silencing factor [Cytophagales bacterium]|nr:ribosome silencing factor [Cytophagales bacterium]